MNAVLFRVGEPDLGRILADAGLEPAPERGKRTRWATFLKAHWGTIAATDFFTVEVVTNVGLVRYVVLFVIDLKTRRVHIAAIAHQMCGTLMEQVARSLTYFTDGPGPSSWSRWGRDYHATERNYRNERLGAPHGAMGSRR